MGLYHTVREGCHVIECDVPGLRARTVDGLVERWKVGEQKQEPSQATEPLGPGTLLAQAIDRVTGEKPKPGRKCKARMRKMNEWDWWKCWRKRDLIADWLAEEAKKRRHQIDAAGAMPLLLAAWREVRRGPCPAPQPS